MAVDTTTGVTTNAITDTTSNAIAGFGDTDTDASIGGLNDGDNKGITGASSQTAKKRKRIK